MKHDLATPTDDLADAEVPCEVCAATASSEGDTTPPRVTAQQGTTEPRAFGERVFWLCAAHRAPADTAPSAEALRAQFQEPGGQRCVLPRRAEDRRVFPPRPEGRRKGAGRRRVDPST